MKIRVAIALCFALSTSAHAATVPLSLTADNSSRWYDFYMGWFAQVDRTASGDPAPNQMYWTDAEANPFNPTAYDYSGSNAIVFKHGRAFSNVGSVSYTGSGNGTFPITAITLDIGAYVLSQNASALGAAYTTTVSNPVGTVQISNGAVADIQLQANIRFEMDASFIPPLSIIPFNGSLAMDGNRFDIFVDGRFNFGHGELHNAWDLTGSIDMAGGDTIFANGFEVR